MKTYQQLVMPALAAMMMLSPAFYHQSSDTLKSTNAFRAPAQVADSTYVHIETPLEKKDSDQDPQEVTEKKEDKEQTDKVVQGENIREKIELIKLEPRGIEPLKIELPKAELMPIPKTVEVVEVEREKVEPIALEPRGIEPFDIEIEAPKLELKEVSIISKTDLEEEEKIEEEKEEVVEVKEETEEVVEVAKIEEDEKPAVDSTYEELTGLVCRQQNQIDRMTASIDTLVESMNSQMQMMQMMTQLMMTNQLASASQPTYGANLFANPMMQGFQAFVFGQKMGSLMNIFSPIPSFNGFGNNQPQQAMGPVNHYNITGDFYGRDYTYQAGVPQMGNNQVLAPQYNGMGYNALQQPNINWMDNSNRMMPPNPPSISSQVFNI